MDVEGTPAVPLRADPSRGGDWEGDSVLTASGVALPVRATSVRPRWEHLPPSVREMVETAVGQRVVGSWSAGTGFTPGFASRVDLADGSRVFVKAASTADDEAHGWSLSGAYRDEARKLAVLPRDIGAPRLLWHRDEDVGGLLWIVLGLEYVDGEPPRRPWRLDQLTLVVDKLAATAAALTDLPPGLRLSPAEDDILGELPQRLARVAEVCPDTEWRHLVERLSSEAEGLFAGDSIVHLDLRDDNVLIDRDGQVWFVDWNWPALGAPWIDIVCLLISAFGDGFDTDAIVATHPLTAAVDPAAIDCLLAVLWSFWEVGRHAPGPTGSPYLRTHQAWYAEVTRRWLETRLAGRRLAG